MTGIAGQGRLDAAVASAMATMTALRYQAAAGAPPDPLNDAALRELANALEELAAAAEVLREEGLALEAARNAASRSERRYRDLFEDSPEAYLETDAAGVIQVANRQAGALLGVAARRLVGKPMALFVAAGARLPFERILQEVALHGAPSRDRPIELLPRGGGLRSAEMSVVLQAHDDTGSGPRLLIAIHDTTVREQALATERALAAATAETRRLRSLATLAGGVAHDFNNLLVAIMGHASLLRGSAGLDGEMGESIDEIVTAAERAAALAHQMLAFSGYGPIALQRLDLSTLVRETVAPLRASRGWAASIELDLDGATPPVLGDPEQLRQAVVALVTNAVEAADDAAQTVIVRTRPIEPPSEAGPPTDWAAVEVRDRGPGLDAAVRERIFDPFISTKGAGRGLGLASVHGTVVGHGGRLVVDDAADGGTIVRVLLPAAASDGPAEPGPDRPAATAADGSKPARCILIVDDERSVATFARRVLERAHLDVLVAEDGPAALEIVADRGPEIAMILLDLTLPTMSGIEVAQRIRAAGLGVPITISSGWPRDGVDGLAELEAPIGYLEKPYTIDALLRAVDAEP